MSSPLLATRSDATFVASSQDLLAGVAPHSAFPSFRDTDYNASYSYTVAQNTGPFMMVSPRNGLLFSLPTASDSDTRTGFLTKQSNAQSDNRVQDNSHLLNGAGLRNTQGSGDAYLVKGEEYRQEGIAAHRYSLSDNATESDVEKDEHNGHGTDETQRKDVHRGKRSEKDVPHCSFDSDVSGANDTAALRLAMDSVLHADTAANGLSSHMSGQNLPPPAVPPLFPPSHPPMAGGNKMNISCGINSCSGSCNPSPRTNTSSATPLSRCQLSRKEEAFHNVLRGGGGHAAVSYGTRLTPRLHANGQGLFSSARSLYHPHSYNSGDANSFFQDPSSNSSVQVRSGSLTTAAAGHLRSNSLNCISPRLASDGPAGVGPYLSTESFGAGRGPSGCDSCPSCFLDAPQQLSPRMLGEGEGTTPRLFLPPGSPTATAQKEMEADYNRYFCDRNEAPSSSPFPENDTEDSEPVSQRHSVGPPSQEPNELLFTRRRYLNSLTASSVSAAGSRFADPMSMSRANPTTTSGNANGEEHNGDFDDEDLFSRDGFPPRGSEVGEPVVSLTAVPSPQENEESRGPTPRSNAEANSSGDDAAASDRSPPFAAPISISRTVDRPQERRAIERGSIGSLMISGPSSLASTVAALCEGIGSSSPQQTRTLEDNSNNNNNNSSSDGCEKERTGLPIV